VSRRGAIAVFVKTIGRSAVKTRLAAAIGREKAVNFYRHCLTATHETVQRACRTSSLDAYWSVAEADAVDDPAWSSFTTIAQGDGELGDRLDRVYRTLLDSHSFVILIGADAPLLSAEVISRAAKEMNLPSGPRFAISRSFDGGYSLFAGRHPIDPELWRSVPYSTSRTAEAFVAQLGQIGDVAELPHVDDIDTFADFERLVQDAKHRPLSPEHLAVVEYARRLLDEASGVG